MSDLALEGARRRGRALGTALYTTILSTFIVVCGTQVMIQGFSSPAAAAARDCDAEILDLIAALRRARAAAAAEPRGERASLERFRHMLLPEWDRDVASVCSDSAGAVEALAAIKRLRYAEEHAVRNQSKDLAASRRQVQAIERSLGLHPGSEP